MIAISPQGAQSVAPATGTRQRVHQGGHLTGYDPHATRAEIASIRKARGWSRRQLALRVGMSRQHVGNVETGEKDLTVSLLLRIAKALGVPVMTLVE
jgi:DNA-binding XRE family transcriptional regulator